MEIWSEISTEPHRCLGKGSWKAGSCGVWFLHPECQYPTLLDLMILYPPRQEKAGQENPRGDGAGAREDALSPPSFKTIADPFAGKLNLFRVYSGSVSADSTIYNSKKKEKERIGQIFLLEGKKQKPVGFAGVGDIVSVAKLKETTTGDTF
jgi:elongation factor G